MTKKTTKKTKTREKNAKKTKTTTKKIIKETAQKTAKKTAKKTVKEVRLSPSLDSVCIGLVVSEFNQEITEALKQGALKILHEAFPHDPLEIRVVCVPGAMEIPLACHWLLEGGFCDGLVVCGAVIRGETSHYDLICNYLEKAVLSLSFDWGLPIGFGVITAETEEQALARAGGDLGNRGEDAALACLKMLKVQYDLFGS
jgi:6,7-dimethyl-8-ribityllumazine synthase